MTLGLPLRTGNDQTVARLDAGRQVVLDRPLLERLLRENGGNRSKTARMLGIGRTTLWRRLRADPTQPSPYAECSGNISAGARVS